MIKRNERHNNDCYLTPVDTSYVIARALKDTKPWFDPFCGPGALLLQAPPNSAGAELDSFWDLHKLDSANITTGIDAFTRDDWGERDYNLVTNPPFNKMKEVIERVAKRQHEVAAVLMRLEWWGGKERGQFRPDELIIMTWRPHFYPGTNDRFNYCWAIWRRDSDGGPTKTSWANRPDQKNLDAAHLAWHKEKVEAAKHHTKVELAGDQPVRSYT